MLGQLQTFANHIRERHIVARSWVRLPTEDSRMVELRTRPWRDKGISALMTTPVQPGRRIVPDITQISATRTVGGEVGVLVGLTVGLTVGLEVGIRVGADVSGPGGQHCENMHPTTR